METISRYPKLVKDFLEISHRLRQRELTFGGGGGISMRIPRSDKVLIKGWEVASEDARTKDVSLVDLGGKRLNRVKPCLETPLHLEVLKAREDIRAVIHAHPPYATAFGNIRGGLKEEQVRNHGFLRSGVFTPYADPGSKTLAEIVARPFHNREVFFVFMEDHGVTVAGPDVQTVYYRLDFLEGTAKAFLLALFTKQAF
jgi:L-fuculose-phosphate aldolase